MVLTPSTGALDLDQLAQLADRILEATPPAISATTADNPNTITTTQLSAYIILAKILTFMPLLS